jgi:uncharacterized membrane protein
MTVQPAAAAEDRILRWVRVCAIALVALGCFIRFDGLGSKVFWWDETHTGRAVAGSFWSEIIEDVFDGRVHSRDQILVHQFPRDGKTTLTTIRTLVWEDPRQTPLYFVLARAWVMTFGSSAAILRAFSAVLSILSLPLVFLLCRELFGRSLEGWIAIGLIAVSPLHFVYAQEARQYMLWVDLVLLAGWLQLLSLSRTQERGRPAWWWFVLYAGALGLALITHLLTVLVMAAQLLFVVVGERFRLTAVVWLTTCAQLVVALLFWPWAHSILAEAKHRAWIPWAATDVGFAEWLRMVTGSYARPFFDIDICVANLKYIDQAPGVFILAVALASVVLLVRFAPPRACLFLILLGSICSMPMVAVDLFSGGWRTVIIRYQFPAMIALQLCVAFGIAHLLMSGERRWRRVGTGTAVLLVTCGLYSGVLYGRAEVWWNKGSARELLAAADYVEQWPAPLVVSSKSNGLSMSTALSLAHVLNDRSGILLVVEPEMPVIPDEYEDVFVWRVSNAMLDRLAEAGWRLEKVNAPDLYRLSRPSEEFAAGPETR